jgi:cold shock CspA family protein
MSDETNSVVEDRRCRDCGAAFAITAGAATFLESRGLALPKRCRQCRAERRSQRAPAVFAIVERYGAAWRGGFGVLIADSGERLIVASHEIAEPPYGPLRPGQRVQIEIEPGAPLRRAADVRVISSHVAGQ